MTTTEATAPDQVLDVRLGVEKIMGLIPHRYPFLMVDRLTEIVLGKSAVGIKNVTFNEPFFQGHFPGHAVFPGVMIIEAMAQTAAAMVVYSLGDILHNKLVYFMGVDEARFRKPVRPGDQLKIFAEVVKSKSKVWKFHAIARVDGQICAEATFAAMIMDRDEVAAFE
jgi:3-hydroxyacyl-[acyl-carrier-protein] dehydratase